MPIFAFTVGSLGDIIALLQLAETCRKALCDSRGCFDEYQEFILELDTLAHTVSGVHKAIDSQGPDQLSRSVENGLRQSIRTCSYVLQQVNQTINRYKLDVQRGSSSMKTMALDIWCRVGWSLFKKEELVTFRLQLAQQIAAMNTLLSLAQGERQSRLAEVHREHYSLNVEISRHVQDMSSRLAQISLTQAYRGGPNNHGGQPFYVHVSRTIFHDFLIYYHQIDPSTIYSLTRELLTRDVSSIITTCMSEARWHPQTEQNRSDSSIVFPQGLWDSSEESHHDLLCAPIFFDMKDAKETYGIRLVDALDRKDYFQSACEWHSLARLDPMIIGVKWKLPYPHKFGFFFDFTGGTPNSKGRLVTLIAEILAEDFHFYNDLLGEELSGITVREIILEGLVQVRESTWQPILRSMRKASDGSNEPRFC